MSQSLTTIEAARNIFQEGFERTAQQMQSRFRQFADVRTGLTGKSHSFRKIGRTEMDEVTGRLQPTVGEEQTWEHRYLFPRKAQKTKILDEDDASELGLAVAPTGEISTEINSAAMRKIDKFFLDGILGPNYEGPENAIVQVPLPNTQIIAPDYRRDTDGGNTGLTLAKLIRGKGRFGKLEVYGQNVENGGDRICMAVSQDELDNLLYEVEETQNADFNKVKALVEGEVDYFMGIHFIRSEQLPIAPSEEEGKIIRSCPMWLKNGVRLGFWTDVTTSIKELSNPDGAIQIRGRVRANACRKDEDRVVVIQCEQDA